MGSTSEVTCLDLAAPSKVVPPSRLRLAHYLLFTAVFSAVAAMQIGWTDGGKPSDVEKWLGRLYTGCTSLLFGAAFTALLILFGRRWRFGQPEFNHPGHWLLAFMAVGALIQGATVLLLEINQPYVDHPYFAYYTWSLHKLLLCSTVGITCFVFSWLTPGNIWWKSILALAGAVMLALVPQHVLVLYGVFRPWYGVAHNYACLVVSVAVFPLLLFACWSDVRHLIQRDWLHWTGVFALAMTAAVEGYYALYWMLWA